MMKSQNMDIRTWIAGPEEQTPPPTVPYETKLVAFIDILGVRDKVKEEGDEAAKIVTLMRQIQKYVETACADLVKKERLNSLQIGDGFFIVADIDCIGDICEILSTVQWRVLVDSQMLLRGVLTAGKVAVGEDDRYFIGPAIIEALELEKRNAIFPRVIYERKKIEEYINKATMHFCHITEDQDKIEYIDYVEANIDGQQLPKEVNEALKRVYEKKIRLEDKSAAQKYGWLISKLATRGIKIV